MLERFIESCKECYIPDADITVNEQLFPSKSKCPLTQYIVSKPGLGSKANLKILLGEFPYVLNYGRRPAKYFVLLILRFFYKCSEKLFL